MFCIAEKEKNISCLYSKHNSNREKQVILLMIRNCKKLLHYLAVKKLSALLRGITSKHYSDFYFLIAFISLEQNANLNDIKEYVNIKIFVI